MIQDDEASTNATTRTTTNDDDDNLKGHETSVRATKRRGFAAMDPELVRAIAQRGGKAAHASGKAHTFTSAEAREAGRKGGATRRPRAIAAKSE